VANNPPLVPVLHRSDSLVVRTVKSEFLSFELLGKEVEFQNRARLQAVRLVRARGDEPEQSRLELLGTFGGATAYGSHPSRRYIGPLPSADAQAALADLNRRLCLPLPIHRVTMQELESDPARYSGQWVEVVVRWRPGFESSSCGDTMHIWLYAVKSEPSAANHGEWYRVVGRFDYVERRGPMTGFGHMGMAPAALTASTMEPVPAPTNDGR
jgi:hypothetical protein